MKKTLLRIALIACTAGLGAFSTYVLATPEEIVDCGTKQLKALAKLADVELKEAARACGTATTDVAPAPANNVNDDKVITATEKFNAVIADTEADFGDANCFLEDSAGEAIDPALVVAETEGLAEDFCTSTP